MASFWLHRPSHARACTVLIGVGLLAFIVTRIAGSWSPLEVRSNLPLESVGMREIYLTTMMEDPARVLLTTRRENSTWTRDAANQRGDPYWIHRYGDPARPGLSDRILLTSRSRGARFLIPLSALDLERALSAPDLPAAQAADAGAGADRAAGVRVSLVQAYLDRTFAGVYLELRFPERPPVPGSPPEEALETLDFDLVVVRGNEVRTTDFLLQPNGRFYRAALAAGRLPSGPFLRNASTGDELVFALWESAGVAATPLFVPIPLFDELALCWGAELPTMVDDRWRVEALPEFELHEPTRELRALATRAAGLQIRARLESSAERNALVQALERLDS